MLKKSRDKKKFNIGKRNRGKTIWPELYKTEKKVLEASFMVDTGTMKQNNKNNSLIDTLLSYAVIDFVYALRALQTSTWTLDKSNV